MIIDTTEQMLRRTTVAPDSIATVLIALANYLPELQDLMKKYRMTERALRESYAWREQRNKTPAKSILSGVRSDETGHPAMGDLGDA